VSWSRDRIAFTHLLESSLFTYTRHLKGSLLPLSDFVRPFNQSCKSCLFRKIAGRGGRGDSTISSLTSGAVSRAGMAAIPLQSPLESTAALFCAACKCANAPGNWLLSSGVAASPAAAPPPRRTLLLCDGPCGRALHPSCAGLTPAQYAAAAASSDPWFCADCV